jgi:hypothetical protein
MLIGKKSNPDLEPGYVWAPYIPMVTSKVVVEGFKNMRRKSKINKIFDLGFDFKEVDNLFTPGKPISSRYANKVVNGKFYTSVDIKKPT